MAPMAPMPDMSHPSYPSFTKSDRQLTSIPRFNRMLTASYLRFYSLVLQQGACKNVGTNERTKRSRFLV
jgi:hypothetical protein